MPMMKSMKRFLSFILFTAKCCAVCGSALLLLLLLNKRYERVMENPYSDANKFRFMDSSYQNIQICNLGSSHGEYAFDYDKFSKESGFECFNFAMASQTYDYDYAILSMYQEHFAKDCIMFIPVSYFSFNNEVVNEEEQEFLNAKYYSFLSPEYIPHYNPYVDLVANRLPILSAGEDIVKIFPALSLPALAAKKQEDNNDVTDDGNAGSVKDKAPCPKQFQQKARDRYRRHMDGKEEYFLPERIGNLYQILDFCKTKGITPVLITTPYTAYYYEQAPEAFQEEFYKTIRSIASDCVVSYYDYSQDSRFGNHLEYFSDADHLNPKGAALFLKIIQQEIPEFRDFIFS